MTSYWLDPAGDDGDDGSFATPWATWQFAADTMVAGDDLTFKDGTYGPWANVDIDTNNGSSGNPIVFQADNPGSAIINFSSSAVSKVDIDVDYIQLIGLIIDGGQANSTGLIRIRLGARDTLIDNCTLRNTDSHGIYCIGNSFNITIQNCTINPASIADSGRDGIAIITANNVTVDNCEIFETDHVGVKVGETGDTHDVMIKDCEIYKTGSHGISITSGARIVTVQDNIIHGDAGGWDDEASGMDMGIRVANAGATITIRNNIIYFTGTSSFRIEGATTGPLDFYNNTIYRSSQDGASVQDGSIRLENITATAPEPTLNIKNNTIFHTNATARAFHSDSGNNLANLDQDYNDWFSDAGANNDFHFNGTTYADFDAYIAAVAQDQNSIDDNPIFVDVNTNDFRLRRQSQCIDAGVDVSLPFNDAAPDIGYWEHHPIVPKAPAALNSLAVY